MFKLKAWDKGRSKMCEVVFIDFMKSQVGLHAIGYGSYCENINDVDILRNLDKDIFDGDILDSPEGERMVVNYHEPEGYFTIDYLMEDGGFSEDFVYDSDVFEATNVGNKFENPELLKVK